MKTDIATLKCLNEIKDADKMYTNVKDRNLKLYLIIQLKLDENCEVSRNKKPSLQHCQ